MYVWFYCNFKWLADNTTYWTMSAKCVTLHNSACYQISGLCEHLRIFWGELPEIQKTYYGPLKRDNLDVVWKSASTNVCWLLQYLLSPTHLFAIAFRELKFGPNLLMFFWYFFLTLLLHDHDFWVFLDGRKAWSSMIQTAKRCFWAYRLPEWFNIADFIVNLFLELHWMLWKLPSESDSYHSEADNVWRPSMTKSHKCWNLTEIQSPFKSRSKRVFVDQFSRVASRSYPSGGAWSSQMSTAKKNLGLYIVVRVISISRPIERCSRTLNSAARLVATNCKR